MNFPSRWEKFKKLLLKEKLDFFIVTNPSNIFYLIGKKIDGLIIFSLTKPIALITDERFKYELEDYSSKNIKIIMRRKSLVKELLSFIRRNRSLKIGGVEKNNITVGLYDYIKNGISGKKIFKKYGLIERLRVIKDNHEIELIREAISITKKSFKKVKSWVKKNISEKELSDLLEMELRKNGANKSSFDIIVAKGARSAFPHAIPSRGRIIDYKKDFLLIDCGANFNGYNSDLTDMFFFAKIPKNIRRFYSLVREAKDIASYCIKAGRSVSSVHQQVKSFFKKEGALKYFLHNTGHGVGIDVHEAPFIGGESKEVFEENMVITIEPGLYKKGLGGVRLEDMFLVKTDGVEILS